MNEALNNPAIRPRPPFPGRPQKSTIPLIAAPGLVSVGILARRAPRSALSAVRAKWRPALRGADQVPDACVAVTVATSFGMSASLLGSAPSVLQIAFLASTTTAELFRHLLIDWDDAPPLAASPTVTQAVLLASGAGSGPGPRPDWARVGLALSLRPLDAPDDPVTAFLVVDLVQDDQRGWLVASVAGKP